MIIIYVNEKDEEITHNEMKKEQREEAKFLWVSNMIKFGTI